MPFVDSRSGKCRSARLDDIDIRVLGGLFASTSKFGVRGVFRGSFKGIANELGLDEDTVRKRVKSLQRTGLLTGWDLYLNPGAVGCRVHSLRIDVDPKLDKVHVIRRIGMVHGVLGVTDMFSGTIAVFMMYKNDLSLKKSMELILGISNGEILLNYQSQYPQSNLQLSPTDWNTIQALRRNPTSSYKELGKATGVSSRVAKRRMERLIREPVITITPRVNLKALQGAVVADMVVSYRDPGFKGSLDGKIAVRIGRRNFRVGWGNESHSHYTFGALGIAEVREIGNWVKGLDGISAISLDLVYDQIIFSDAYDEYLPEGVAL